MEPTEGRHIFTRLIPDLQRYTLRDDPQTLASLSQTSSHYRRTLTEIYSTFCKEKPITRGEASRYINAKIESKTGKITFARSRIYEGYEGEPDVSRFSVTVLDLDFRSQRNLSDKLKIFARRSVEYRIFEDMANGQNVAYPLQISYTGPSTSIPAFFNKRFLDRNFDADSDSKVELGLSNQFSIFARREQCQRIDPQFANKRIIAALQYLQSGSETGDFITVLCIAIRLDVELIVTNISYSRVIESFSDTFFSQAGIRADTGEDYLSIFRQDNQRAVALLIDYYSKVTI